MKWITREHKIKELIVSPARGSSKSFVDPQAEFIFVLADKVMDEAKRLGAAPYDVPCHVELGHHGEDVSFNSITQEIQADQPRATSSWRKSSGRRIHIPSNPHPAGEGLHAGSPTDSARWGWTIMRFSGRSSLSMTLCTLIARK